MLENETNNNKSLPSELRHKLIFVGDSAVGKTSIIARIIDNPFNETYHSTINLDNCTKILIHNNKKIKLQIWDTAGQEKFRSLITSYIRNASIVVIVYDISNRDSYLHLENWVNYINSIENTIIVICGNKIDLESSYILY